MFQSKPCPFEQDIEKATSENNTSEDWSLIMSICDKVVNYSDGAKICLKAIVKRLNHNTPRVVLQALTLLDSCVKNCDRKFLLQVASSEFTTEIRKLLGKMHPSCADNLKMLLQKWSMEDFKDDPELCIIPALYYKLKSEGFEFPSPEPEKKRPASVCTNPDAVTSQQEEDELIRVLEISKTDTGRYAPPPDLDISSASAGAEVKTLPDPIKTRAIYDFEADEDNELTIKAGEIVLVLDNSNSSWWKGSNHRGEGLFPANFVTEDLDYHPEETAAKSAQVVDEVSEVPSEEIKIDEGKIDTVLNWLSDVDPTEELTDPEDMLKLEKECYKMGPLIEENLNTIDNRLARMNLVNDKIMASFDLFHDLSSKYSTLPSNMAMPPNVMQIPFPYQSLPHSMQMMPSNVLNAMSLGTVPSLPTTGPVMQSNLTNTASQGTVLSSSSNTTQTMSDSINTTSTEGVQSSTNHLQLTLPVSSANVATTTNTVDQPINPVINAATAMHPIGGVPYLGNVYGPPTVPLPFPANVQGGFIPVPPSPQCVYQYPYQQMGQIIPYPFYMNNPVYTAISQAPVSATLTQTPSASLSTSTSVSNVLSSSPLPSVSSYYSDLQQIATLEPVPVSIDQSSKSDSVQNPASGDGHASSSTSNSDNS